MVCAQHFPPVGGIPVLLAEPAPVEVMPSDLPTSALPTPLVEQLSALDGWWLHVGAGTSDHKIANCIEVDLNVFSHTSLVGDVHRLPFVPDAFQAIVAFHVLEHLPDPQLAASELHRVLAPGGEVVIRTAGVPAHQSGPVFYYATELGLRRWFRRYEVLDVEVLANAEAKGDLAAGLQLRGRKIDQDG